MSLIYYVFLFYLYFNLYFNVYFNFVFVNGLYLTPQQMKSIVILIKNKDLKPVYREKINSLLYSSYEKWAIQKALEFKKFHNFKCQNIHKEDLIISSKFGLYKCIKRYNGNTSFVYFANLYIKYELLYTLTTHFSSTGIPRQWRISNKKNISTPELENYRRALYPIFISYDNNWKFDKLYTDNDRKNRFKMTNVQGILELELDKNNNYHMYEGTIQIWNEIDKLDPFTKRILYLKYDFVFNKKCNNKYISQITGYSQETIRKKIHKGLKKVITLK